MTTKNQGWIGAVVTMNNYPIMTLKPKTMQAMVLSSIGDLKYWSYPSLVRLYRGLGRTLSDYSKIMRENHHGPKRSQYTRFIRQYKKRKLVIPRKRNELLAKIYETILANEGLYIWGK